MPGERRRWKRTDPNNERGRSAVRYRAYPDAEQQVRGRRIAGSCRALKNLAKEQRDLARRFGHGRISYSAQSADLKALRDDPEIAPWLAEVPAQVLQQALRDSDTAYRRFLSGGAGYPAWARRSGWAGFRDPQDVKVRRLSRRWGEIKIQGVGWVRVRMHRPLIGSRVCSATWTEEPDGKVFISVLVERHKRRPTKPRIDDPQLAAAVGVDRGGVVAAATASVTETCLRDFVTLRTKEAERLRRLEQARERQKIARRKENTRLRKAGADPHPHASRRQDKTERAIAGLHARKRRRSRDFAEQTSNDLAKNHSLVVFENLHIKSMAASAKGTIDAPGKNVAAKAGMNRSFLSKAPASLRTRTARKVTRHGHQEMGVNPAGTSITCSACGHVDADSRHDQRFCCTLCGHRDHADTNAAANIRERGIKLALAGGTPVAAPRSNDPGPGSPGAETVQSRRRGSGNQKTDYFTTRQAM